MGYKLTVLNIALLELEEAATWYSEISKELSTDLVSKYIDGQRRIQEKPLARQELKGGYRKINLKRFPFKIVYKVFDEEIIIVAFAHHKQMPHYWKTR
jgi:hypothetical protein